MKEFGSDFHRCNSDYFDASQSAIYDGHARFYACGRHAIDALVKSQGWKRIWMPAYFCYEVIGHIRSTGIEVKFYDDYPLQDPSDEETIIRSLPYEDGDVLLRTDYFGLRSWRTNKGIRVPVIEDHTHGLTTDWAIKSEADWCIASLRKTLPVAAGGVVWSPKHLSLPACMDVIDACSKMAAMRYEAMDLKAEYLAHGGDKNVFREKYVSSEEMIDNLEWSGIDMESNRIAHTLNVKRWTEEKVANWNLAVANLSEHFQIIGAQLTNAWQPFSVVLLLPSHSEREALRTHLIKHCVYPAVLWKMPSDTPFTQALDFSERMLSIHCDARYSKEDIKRLCKIILSYHDTNL